MCKTKRTTVVFLSIGLAFLLLLAEVRPAVAVPTLPSEPVITLDPTSGAPGSTVVVQGRDFLTREGSTIQLHWDTLESPLIGSGVNESGTFTLAATIPPKATAGLHTIIAWDVTGDAMASAGFTVTGEPLEAVYVHGFDEEKASDFQTLLQTTGMISTTLVPLGEAAATDFSRYDLIVVGPDTGAPRKRWASDDASDRIRDSGKPILCVGLGGYQFFGNLSLHVGPPFGNTTASGREINLADAFHPLYQTPYNKSSALSLTLYTADTQMVYLPSPSRSYVSALGQTTANGISPLAPDAPADDYTLAQQAGRYFLWGFDGGPVEMTQDGRELFVNAAWSLVKIEPDIDTLILVDYQRMKDIGYSSTDVNTLESRINTLVGLHPLQSNMTAVVKRLNLDTPTYVQTGRTTWTGNDNSVSNTNTYVALMDYYIESLKKSAYPNLEYVIFVGAHEVIPMKARDTDDMSDHKERDWAANDLPQTSGYLYSMYHDAGANNLGHYLTDSVYGDLSYINNGHGADDELIPELAVGRLVETPAQISTLLDNYMASQGTLSRANMAAIGSNDYVDGALTAAGHMGSTADKALAKNNFDSSLVPPKINAHNDIVYIGGHGDYNWMTTGTNEGFMAGHTTTQGDTEELSNMPDAVVVASGCHNGVNLGNMRYHDYTSNTTYADFPERFANRQVGIYLGSTGYTWISGDLNTGGDCNQSWCTGWSEKLATHFLKHLFKGSMTTAGAAYLAAVNEYVSDYSDFGTTGNPHRRVLAIATLYGMPHYHWPRLLYIPWYEYFLRAEWVRPLDPVSNQATEKITLNVESWKVDPSGFLDVAGLPASGASNEPTLPRVHVSHVLPPDSNISGVIWDPDASESETIDHDVPLVNMAVLTYPVPNTFFHDGFYPPTPFYTRTVSAPGGGGFETRLTIVPVQYNPATHQTRIWHTMVLTVEYQVDQYGLGADSDGDGLPDYWESGHGLSPNDAEGDNGASGDPDEDGLTNEQERELGTHPLEPDTDHDGQDDGTEVAQGTDPLNPGSRRMLELFLPLVLRNHPGAVLAQGSGG